MNYSARISEPLLITAFSIAALLAGGASALLPWFLTLAIAFIPIFALFAGAFPHHAIAVAIFLAFGAVPSFMLPQIPFAGGTIRASELFLALITGISAFKVLANPERVKQLQSPFTPGLLLILGLTTLSLTLAATALGNQPKYYLYELRSLLFWLVLPLILLSIDTREKAKTFAIVLAAMGFVLAAGVIIQFVTGMKILEASRVEKLVTTGSIYSDVTRSTAGGGIYFILFLINVTFVLWIKRVMKWYFATPIIAFGAMAVIATFGRGVWAAEACAILLILFLADRGERVKTLAAIASIALVGMTVMYITAPHVANATFDRLTSVGNEIEDGDSYQWRKDENRYAQQAILSNPIVGVGLGGEYQPFRNRNMGEDHTRAIHSSYYGLMLKLGVAGLIIPALMGAIGLATWRRIEKSQAPVWLKATSLATMATVFTAYITSFTQPEWMHHTGVAFFATSFALLAVSDRLRNVPTREE